ncbi:ATP-binding protein [Streptomyces sp. NPDC047000]|uniref:ATP-binding protein n=1 Tax=Streptomyces sp. NPDC047000 TaxID=3155474 RepID=UPI0033D8F82E
MPTHPLLHEDQLDYTPTTRSVPLARQRVARLAVEWGYRARADDIAVVASEVLTNALLHGSLRDRLIRVRLAADAAGLRIEVSDPRGERLPEARDACHGEQFGRGLAIVGALADKWGVCPRGGVGKTVWAEWEPVPASGAGAPPALSETSG